MNYFLIPRIEDWDSFINPFEFPMDQWKRKRKFIRILFRKQKMREGNETSSGR